MNKIRNFIREKPIPATFIIVLVILLLFFNIHFYFFSDDLINRVLKEALFAIITLVIIYFITGKTEVNFSTKGIAYAFKKCWWVLTIPGALGITLTAISLISSKPFAGNPFLILILTLLETLFIGIFEESLMRGLIFNSLLSKFGNSYKNVLTAIILSSVIFGFAHVAPDFIKSFPQISLDAACQMVGKTIQSGMLGFILAAIYLRNHNLWSIAFIHGLNDFFMLCPLYLFNLQETNGYVQESGNYGIIYFGMSILSIPFIFTAIKIIKNTPLPQYGFFKEKWTPLEIRTKY